MPIRIFSSGTNSECARRIDDQPAAGEPFADIVVGVAFQSEPYALGQERAKTLARAAIQLDANGIFRQARGTIAPRNLAAQHGAHGAMHVANGQADGNRDLLFKGLLALLDQVAVERRFQAMILRLELPPAHVTGHGRVVK